MRKKRNEQGQGIMLCATENVVRQNGMLSSADEWYATQQHIATRTDRQTDRHDMDEICHGGADTQ